MRIALGQLDMTWEDKEASLQKAEQMISFAAGHAELIVFPEMTLTGFSMNLHRIGEEPGHSWSVERMRELAVKYGIAIGFGWAALPDVCGQSQVSGEKTEDFIRKGTNRFSLIDKKGNVLGEYCKIHPFSYGGEADAYEGGSHIVTVPFLGRSIGLFICYDLRFPEIFQVASKEADILLVIANWPASRREHWRVLLQARAIENQSYVAGINCTGERDGLTYTGDSAVFDAQGNLLAQLSSQEDVLFCELDDCAWDVRDRFRMRQDRKEELYCSMMGRQQVAQK